MNTEGEDEEEFCADGSVTKTHPKAKEASKQPTLRRSQRKSKNASVVEVEEEATYKSSKDFLRAHMKPGDRKCILCGKVFLQSFQLKRHLKTHSGIREHKCPKCPKAFVDKERLTMHMRIHLQEKHKCTICKKSFRNRQYLKTHLKRHTDHMKYRCALCERRFVSYDSIRTHIIYMHYRKNFSAQSNITCDVCGETFPKKEYVKHRNKHNYKLQPMDCFYCGKTLRTYSTLKRHSETYHNSLPVDPRVDPIVCTVCKKSFKNLQLLKNHYERNHATKSYECDTCGSRFELKEEFKDHIQINHVTEGIYPCFQCGKLFESKGKVNRHRESTHIDYSFVCCECPKPKAFSSDYYLSRHVENFHRVLESPHKLL